LELSRRFSRFAARDGEIVFESVARGKFQDRMQSIYKTGRWHPDGDDNKTERFVTVLEIPPVDSPQTAVKMSIYSDIKKRKIAPS
jgi:hypothetical protein